MHWFLESDHCAVGVCAVYFCCWLCSAVTDEDFRDSDRPCPIY